MPGATEIQIPLTGVTYTDKSGTITTASTAQSLMLANASRNGAFVYNPATSGSLWINFLGGTASVNGAGSVEVVPGQMLVFDATNAVTIISATASAKFTSGEA